MQGNFCARQLRTAKNGNPVPVQRYQFDNHLGSAVLELDENASVISYEEYYPYGDTSYQAGRSTSEASQKRYRYTGKEKDEESGLYYYGARYYSPMAGIFISVDPKFEKYPQISSYAYCMNNPVKYTDPDGKEIRLEGTEDDRRGILTNLQNLTNDKLSTRPNDDGTSSVIIKEIGGANPDKYLKTGSELIQNLSQLGDSAKTVTIKPVTDKNYAYVAYDSDETNARNRIGANAIIDFNLRKKLDVLVKDTDTGELFTETMASHIILAHELIHAYNINKGIKKTEEKEPHTYQTHRGRRTELVEKEELNTMGVSGYDGYKFTENKIRAEHGQNIRRAYWWVKERFF